jgi:hypothetical protein
MDLCIILHCILFVRLSPAGSFNIQLPRNYSAATALFWYFLLASLSPFFWVAFLYRAYHLRDVSTQQHEADRAVVACNAGLHPEGTAPQQ